MTRTGTAAARTVARTTGRNAPKTDGRENQDRRASCPPVLFSLFGEQAIQLFDTEFEDELLEVVGIVQHSNAAEAPGPPRGLLEKGRQPVAALAKKFPPALPSFDVLIGIVPAKCFMIICRRHFGENAVEFALPPKAPLNQSDGPEDFL